MGSGQSVNQQRTRKYAESTTVDAAASRVGQQEFWGWCKAGDHEKVSTTLQGLQGDATHRDTLLTAAKGWHQRTPLHLAAMEGRKAVVEVLVAAGANLEAQTLYKYTPLHLAANYGKEAIVEALVAVGANLEAQDYLQHTPLHLAAREGKEAAVRALVAAGANLEAKGHVKDTPLHIAEEKNRKSIVEALKTAAQCTPLHRAVMWGKEAAVQALVAAGANLEAQDKEQRTPLHQAAYFGKEAAVRALVAAGANLEAQDKEQRTPLHRAAYFGKEAAVRALVAPGANLEALDQHQDTPLHLAAKEGKQAAVRALVAAGANLEARNKTQSTPLFYAALNFSKEAVQALVAAGANLEAQNQYQRTPLHLAARERREAVVRALVAAGANLEAKDKDQHTPLQLAEQQKHNSAVEVLKQAASTRLAAQHQDQAPLAAFLKALDLESHTAGIWASAGIAEPSDFSLLTEGGWAALQEATSLTNIQLKKLKRCAESSAAGPATAPSSNPCPFSPQTPLPDFLASLRLGAFAGRIRHALGVAHAGDLAFWAREADWEGLRPFMKEVQVAKLRKAVAHQDNGKSFQSSGIQEQAEEFVAGLLLSARVLPCSPLVDFLGCLGLCQCGGRMKELLGVVRAEDLTLADTSEWAALRNFMTQIQVAKLELALQCVMKNEGKNETTKDAAPPADVPLSEYLETIGLPPNLSICIQRTIGASQAEDLALAEDRDWTTLRSFMTRKQVEKLQLAVQGRTVSSSYGGFREETDNCTLKQNDRPEKAGNYDSCENKLCKNGGTTEVKGVQESKNSCRPCTPADAKTTGKGHQVFAEEKTDNKNSTIYQYKTTQPSAPGVLSEEKGPSDGETTQPSAPGLPPEEEGLRDGEEEHLCCVCLDQPKTIVLLPCRHMCLCSECAAKMALCPLCKEEITQRIQPFT